MELYSISFKKKIKIGPIFLKKGFKAVNFSDWEN